MSLIKNKQTLFLVVRTDNVVCAITLSEQKAQELCGEFEQDMLDIGRDEFSYCVQGQIFYDE